MRHRCRGYARSAAFTLVEVLVVLSIVTLLAALLLPALATSRSLARRTACTSQLHQVSLAIAMYGQDYDNLPPHLSVIASPYLNDARVLVCPSDPDGAQRDGNDYLEGTIYMPTGVSYQYYPQWQTAQDLAWYTPAPNFGRGKWDDLTPLAGCVWHWAKTFNKTQQGDLPGSKGWQMILTLGGSVRRTRVEDPVSVFDPGKYY